MNELRECLVSTMIGSNLMRCIFISCIVRFVVCNKDAVHRLSFEHDTNAGSELLDIVYNWFTSDVSKSWCITWNIYHWNNVAQFLLILVYSISRSANVWKYPALVTTEIYTRTQAMRYLVRVC